MPKTSKLKRKFYRSTSDRVISGVCGGIATYFNIDSNIIRLAWILVTCFTGFFPGVIAYILCALIIPQ